MDRKQQPGGPLEMFVIYDHPKDCPGHFVVRRWLNGHPTKDFVIADTLEDSRAEVPSGLCRIHRYVDDDSVIVETWV